MKISFDFFYGLISLSGAASASAAKQMGLDEKEAKAFQEKLAAQSAAAAAVSTAEMNELKKKLAAKDIALGGMKKQMELMGTSQLQEARDEFER